MKTSYRKASEMSGFVGVVVRGEVYDKILRGFYRQPEIRAAVMQAIAAGSVYISVVLGLTLLLGLSWMFAFIGALVGFYFTSLLLPLKKWFVYLSGRIDEEFEL